MIYIFLRKLSSSPEWVSLLCLVSYCSQQLIETRVCEKVAAVAFLEVYSVFVREYGNGFRFLFVPGGGGGRISFRFRLACWEGWLTINVRVFTASFFAQRRAGNASDKQVIGDEAQGTMGNRKMIGDAHLTLPPSCLVCAQMFIERERRLCTRQPMKCVTRIENYELKKTSPWCLAMRNKPTTQR